MPHLKINAPHCGWPFGSSPLGGRGGTVTNNASTNVLNIIWCMYAYTAFGQMPKWKRWIIIQGHIHNKTWACLVG